MGTEFRVFMGGFELDPRRPRKPSDVHGLELQTVCISLVLNGKSRYADWRNASAAERQRIRSIGKRLAVPPVEDPSAQRAERRYHEGVSGFHRERTENRCDGPR